MRRRQRGNGQGSVYKRPGRSPWYIAYQAHDGRRRIECSGTTVKAAAERLLAQRLAEAMLRRTGVIDVRQEAATQQGKRTVEDHLAEYKAMLEARKRGAGHVRRTLQYIREIAGLCGWQTVADIGPDCLNRAAADMTAEGYAARTIGARIKACKGFVKWLSDHDKLPRNSLLSVKAPSVDDDRRHRRRMLLPDEWPWLEAAILANGYRNGMSPAERVVLYKLVILTGMRASEVESLTKGKLILAGKRPHVLLRAENTKNKKETRQYIPDDLAIGLTQLASRKLPTAAVFSVQAACDMAEALRADMADARKAWIAEAKRDPVERERREQSDFLSPVNHQGESLDFHALRHTCGAWLVIQGENVKTVQTVMRHSTIKLTFDTYGHLLPDSASDAVNTMGRMFGSGKQTKKRLG